jgi:hypothetical protein
VQAAYAIECSEVGDYSIKVALNTIELFNAELFDAEDRSIDAAAAGDAYHLGRSVDGADGDPIPHKVKRILTSPATDVEQHVTAREKYIQAPPHSFSLQATDRRASPQLVISRRYPIEGRSCACCFRNYAFKYHPKYAALKETFSA